MNSIGARQGWKQWAGTGVLVFVGMCAPLTVPRAWAHSASGFSDSYHQGARVMSHLPLDETSYQDAIYRESGGHRYIYIQNAGSTVATIVDVTRRGKPKVTGSISLPDGARLSEVSFQGDVIMVSSGAGAGHGEQTDVGDVTIWDMSKQGTPKVVKHFNHVKKVFAGPSGVDYVLDADGLWVVQTYSQHTRDWDDYLDHLAE
jgi:hypothetical protein